MLSKISCIIFLVVFVIIFTPNFSFAEELEMKWYLEGPQEAKQLPKSLESYDIVEPEDIDKSDIEQNRVEFFSEEVLKLNDPRVPIEERMESMLEMALRKQQQLTEENWSHKIKYWDRYGDAYVSVAAALLDPITNNTFIIAGIKHDENPNSNLEYYLLERGYDLNNLDSIPNWAFNPVKYDLAREMMVEAARTGGTVDLRDLSPNYMGFDDESIAQMMAEDMREQSQSVYEKLVSDKYQSAISDDELPEIDIVVNPRPSEIFPELDTFIPIYQDTSHVQNSINNDDLDFFEAESQAENNLAWFVIIALAIGGIAIAIYKMQRKPIETFLPEVIVPVSVPYDDYVQGTKSMLQDSLQLYENKQYKKAHEKLAQAIRHYYSNQLELKIEMTNLEILPHLKKNNISEYTSITGWLNLCGLVEFAKEETHKQKFIKAVTDFGALINSGERVYHE